MLVRIVLVPTGAICIIGAAVLIAIGLAVWVLIVAVLILVVVTRCVSIVVIVVVTFGMLVLLWIVEFILLSELEAKGALALDLDGIRDVGGALVLVESSSDHAGAFCVFCELLALS